MRLVPILLLCIVTPGIAQTIATRTITPGVATAISLSPQVTTTLLLPSVPSGTFGLGLVGSGGNVGSGSVQIEHPDGSPILVLHPLSETAAVTMTVLMDGALYVFDLRSAPKPDIAVTLVKQGSIQDPTAVPRAVEVTPEEIKAARIKYDPEVLIGFLRRARDVNILRPVQPGLYEGYKSRDVQYTSENQGLYKTTVVTIHRFSREDATVLQGTVENLSDHPLSFDGRATTVLVANEVHPAKLTDCLRPIPPHQRTLIDVVLQGDVDGGRANLSIDNEFRIILPVSEATVWNLKNGGSPSAKFRVPAPAAQVPLSQAGKAKRESE